MSDNITELIESIIKQNRSLDLAEASFRHLLEEDKDLRDEYKEWCDAKGYTERKGFSDYFQEYVEREDSIWDSLNIEDEY